MKSRIERVITFIYNEEEIETDVIYTSGIIKTYTAKEGLPGNVQQYMKNSRLFTFPEKGIKLYATNND